MAVPIVDVNGWAILIAAAVNVIIGSLWFSPILFGNAWMKLSGITAKDIAKAKKDGMGKKMTVSYVTTIVCALLTAYILANFLAYVSASSISDALQLGFLAWLGFLAPAQLSMVLWEGKPFRLYLINTLYYLVALLVSGIIIVSF